MLLITNAILEGAQKHCSDRLIDGEELRNSYIFSVDHSILALPLCAFKDTAVSVAYGGWYLPRAWNLGTVTGFALFLHFLDPALT